MHILHFSTDSCGDICRINFSQPQRDSFFDIPLEDVAAWYEAMKTYHALLTDPANCLRFKMTPGKAFVNVDGCLLFLFSLSEFLLSAIELWHFGKFGLRFLVIDDLISYCIYSRIPPISLFIFVRNHSYLLFSTSKYHKCDIITAVPFCHLF